MKLILSKLWKKSIKKGLVDIENFDGISNLCEISDEELEIDDLKNAKEKIENFSEILFPKTNNENIENNRLSTLLLLAIRFDKAGKTNVFSFEEFKERTIRRMEM